MDRNVSITATTAARTLRRDLAALGLDVSHSAALELVAHQAGFRDWNTAAAATTGPAGQLRAPVPVLRVQDGAAALEFYTAVLGFTCLWEHRFEPDLPLYARVRRDDAELDLSEHYGDGTRGRSCGCPSGTSANCAVNSPRGWPPGSSRGSRTTRRVADDDRPRPFGNSLRFCQQG